MIKSDVYNLALSAGFKPKLQALECGATVQDLNPYVYRFAEMVANKYNAELKEQFEISLKKIEALIGLSEVIQSKVRVLEASRIYWEKAAVGLAGSKSQEEYMYENHNALFSVLDEASSLRETH